MLRRATLVVTTAISLTCLVAAPAAAAAPLAALPKYDHVIVLIEENESIDKTYGAASPANYLKSLARQGAFENQYYGIGHASLDNYVAMLSGIPDLPQTGGDCMGINLFTCAQGQLAFGNGRNLTDQYDENGVSWKGFMDGTTAPCQHADYSMTASPDTWQGNGSTPPPAGKDYADRHNPFLYFPDIIGTARCAQHVFPYSQLSSDIAGNTVPQFGFITPDTCHDGHDNPCSGQTIGGLVTADAWLSLNAPTLLSYLNSHNGLLLITTDEGQGQDTSGCCTGGPGGVAPGIGGLVGMVALGPNVKAGKTVGTPYDHMSLLRFLEDEFGISEHLNNASGASPLNDLFTTSVNGVVGGPLVLTTPPARAPGLPPTGTAGPRRQMMLLTGLAIVLLALLAAATFGVNKRLHKPRPRR